MHVILLCISLLLCVFSLYYIPALMRCLIIYALRYVIIKIYICFVMHSCFTGFVVLKWFLELVCWFATTGSCWQLKGKNTEILEKTACLEQFLPWGAVSLCWFSWSHQHLWDIICYVFASMAATLYKVDLYLNHIPTTVYHDSLGSNPKYAMLSTLSIH